MVAPSLTLLTALHACAFDASLAMLDGQALSLSPDPLVLTRAEDGACSLETVRVEGTGLLTGLVFLSAEEAGGELVPPDVRAVQGGSTVSLLWCPGSAATQGLLLGTTDDGGSVSVWVEEVGVSSEGAGKGVDGDGDGVTPPEDCDDTDPHTFPGAAERCDGLDNQCRGELYPSEADADGDGLPVCAGDCDDDDAAVYPGAAEAADDLDADCDGRVDEGTSASDADGDGFSPAGGDCDDTDALVGPHVDGSCGPVDRSGQDEDRDGWSIGEGDCDDADPRVHPGSPVEGTGADMDCDGAIEQPYGCGAGALVWVLLPMLARRRRAALAAVGCLGVIGASRAQAADPAELLGPDVALTEAHRTALVEGALEEAGTAHVCGESLPVVGDGFELPLTVERVERAVEAVRQGRCEAAAVVAYTAGVQAWLLEEPTLLSEELWWRHLEGWAAASRLAGGDSDEPLAWLLAAGRTGPYRHPELEAVAGLATPFRVRGELTLLPSVPTSVNVDGRQVEADVHTALYLPMGPHRIVLHEAGGARRVEVVTTSAVPASVQWDALPLELRRVNAGSPVPRRVATVLEPADWGTASLWLGVGGGWAWDRALGGVMAGVGWGRERLGLGADVALQRAFRPVPVDETQVMATVTTVSAYGLLRPLVQDALFVEVGLGAGATPALAVGPLGLLRLGGQGEGWLVALDGRASWDVASHADGVPRLALAATLLAGPAF